MTVLALLGLLGCTGADADPVDTAADVCATAPAVTWDGWAHGWMTTWCLGCHNSANTDARFGAPVGVDFDTEAATYALADRVRARVLDEETMPVGGGLSDDDRYLLDLYLRCTLGK